MMLLVREDMDIRRGRHYRLQLLMARFTRYSGTRRPHHGRRLCPRLPPDDTIQ